MKIRNAARIVLLDQHDRLFLFKIEDPYNPELKEFWVTPGGGVDLGESFEEAAKRELWEETGIEGVEIGPWIWTREAVFQWEDGPIQAHERYYLVRVTAVEEVNMSHFTSLEQESYRSHKWWTMEELMHSRETFIPGQLKRILPSLLEDKLPMLPLVIS
ncbi:MAG TPA: NUDIX domain-containing protein [Candidatus Bathyarchaeia archaeon]|nr:NUDIX domain-containing protein [Candidatus Bathyarchaeia archaeon]